MESQFGKVALGNAKLACPEAEYSFKYLHLEQRICQHSLYVKLWGKCNSMDNLLLKLSY